MASSAKMFAEVVIAGSYRGLSKSTRGASKEMNTLAGKTKATAKVMSAAIAGISFAAIGQQLYAAAKAADEDRRSMALLNKTLDNSWKASDKTKTSVDDFIGSMSAMSGIADDDLRPAYAKIATTTKDMAKANKYFSMSMDIAAYSGKDLNTVSLAMAKFLGGNTSALDKMVPGLKDAANKMDFLKKKTGGMAKIAGDNSPFARMTIQFDEMKEKIGKELLPYVDKLAKWMNSKEGQKVIKETTAAVIDLVREAGKLVKWAIDNKEVVIAFAVALKGWQLSNGIISSWKSLSGIWKGMKAPKIPPTTPGGLPTTVPTKTPGGIPAAAAPAAGAAEGTGAATASKALGIGASTAIAAGATAAVAVYGTTMVDLYNKDKAKFTTEVNRQVSNAQKEYGKYYSASELLTATGQKQTVAGSLAMGNMSTVGSTTININGVVSGNDVVKVMKNYAKTRGIPLGQLLR